ncbi:uncharacterized protein LOC110597004 isoform X5 [Ictidomys tridecemlineatus]
MSAGMARAWKKFVYLSLGTKVIGYNPIGKIHQAAKNCELKRIERYLGRGCHVDDTDQKNRTPLHYACAYGNPAVVTLLVKRKCNVDLCDSDGNTPLMKALQYEEEECAILLLEHGANPNVHNNKGETPLHCAIFYRSTSVATKLLSFNADIEARNTSGQTPLLFAIKKKRQMMVEFFINNKANIHAVDDKGRTALMFAVEHKSTQIAELLLQCGVNVSASDKCGRIALSYAIASGSTANRNLILQYMKAESRTSAIFSSVKESSEADALIRSPEKSDPGDSCIAKGEGNYEAHIKNILEEGGKLTKASRQSTKDEAKYDTGSRRSENLPDSSTPASQKKEVVETTLVQEIRIKNYSPFFPSPDSKPKQANTGCRVLNVEKFHPCLPGSVIGPFSYEEIVSQIPQNDVGHLPGDAHQTAKDDVNGHIEATSHGVDHGASEGTATHGLTPRTAPMDVVPMSSQMSESSSFQFVRAEDTVKEDTPLSCMAFQDFTHCFVKPILDRRCFLQKNIVRRTEERLCKSDKPLWFSSSEEEEEEEEGLDDTQNKQPQILSEAHPQMLISQSSGKKHYRAKEKADGHDHDMGSICSHSRGSRKSHPVTPENAGEEDAQEEPASYRASWDTSECTKHTERPVTVKEPDPCPGPGKAEAETVRSAENLVDVTSEEEQESSDDTLHNQPQILSEAHPQMRISQSSGEKHYKAKEKADGHDCVKEPIPCPGPGKAEAETVRSDVRSICSHSRGSRKSKLATPQNTGEEDAQEEPASYRASWDTTECTKHTERPVTVKEPDPCPGPGKAEAETVRSAENLFDVTSEEEQESSDDTLHNQPQILSEALLQMQLSHSSGEKQHRAKEETDGHDRDMGPICSHSRGSRKSNPVSPENAEEVAQEEPASYRASWDTTECTKHTERPVTVKEPDPCPGPGKAEAETVRSASWDTTECTKHTERPVTVKEPDPCPGPGKAEAETVRSAENLVDVTSEEEQESSDDTLHNQPQIISEALLQMQLSHSSGEKQHRAKEETDGHDRDMGPICSHSRGSRKSNPVTPENAGEEDAQEEPASYRASRDASACTKHTERPITVKEPDPCPGPGKAEAETVRSAENLFDVTSEEEQESSDDTLHNQPQIISEALLQMQLSHSSGEKQHRAKEETDGHDRDMGPICSHSRGSRKSNPVTPENAGEEDAQEEPASYRASRDASACTKHTERPVTVKEPDPCPGPGKAEAETVRSENLVDVTSEEEQESSDDTLHNQPQIFSEAHPQMQISLSSGKKHHRAKEKADGHDRDSVILLKTQKDVLRFQRKMKPKKHHCSQCSLHLKRNAQLENENFEVKKVLSEFQQENAELKQQLHDLRCALKEEAKRRNDELLREKHKDQLKEKEAEYNKEDKVRKQAEISVDTLGTKLRTARNHFDQIPTRDESDNKPLHKNHKTKDEISMRRLRTDPIKYQNQEKKCLKNTEILTEKDVDLPKTVKLNEKTLAKTFQDNEQLDIWKAERTLQNCTPESEKQRTERPETKVTSHPARPSAAPHHQGDSPTPKRNLELAFQRARDKDFSSQEEKNIDVINLEVSSEIPSQQAPKSKIQTSDLENELRKTRGTLRVMTLATQQVNRQLKQRQCQLKGMEHGHQNEQRKRNAQLRKQEASREKVSKLQSETALLQDQLHDYQNKANDKKDEIINIQSQFQDIIKRIQAQNDKHYLMLENEYMELTSETNHLKEQLDHYGKEKEVVVVRHLEKQPAGILKLPSASPEDLPHFHTNLKDKRRDLKKTLRHMTSQINDLTTKMDSASSKHLRLEANYQCFLQNLFSLKSIQDRFETIDKNQKKLEEDVVNFPRHTQGTRVEGGTEQTARCDLDEKQKQTQAAAPEVSEQLRQTGSASIKTQMELRISNLESELKTKKYN